MSTSLDTMSSFLPRVVASELPAGMIVPAIIAEAGNHAAGRFVEFFTATIRNRNTRLAYGRAVGAFLVWCEAQGLTFDRIGPVMIAGYVEMLLAGGMAKPPRSNSTSPPFA